LLIGQEPHVEEREGGAVSVPQALFDRQALFIKLQGPGIAALAFVDGADVVQGTVHFGLHPQALSDRQAFFKKLHGLGIAALIVADVAGVVQGASFPFFVALFAEDGERAGVL